MEIIWSKQAVESVKSIYRYYKTKSPQGANNVKADLLNSPKTIYFAQQYQVDETNPKYRRIIVRNYKILYTEQKNRIHIIDVVSTRQWPAAAAR